MTIVVYKCGVPQFYRGFREMGVNVLIAHPNSVEAIVKKPLIIVVGESLAVIGYWNPELLSQVSCDWVT